jgi:hypothetical protein
MSESILATPRNMKRFDDVYGVMAYSRTTGEEYSASSGDYWNRAEDEPLVDESGDPMVLVVRVSNMVDVDVVAPEL